MIESLVISGNFLVAFTIWFGMICLFGLTRILIPNHKEKQIALGKAKPSNDNVTRFFGAIWFALSTYILLHVFELV